jgi:AcrR family transcriptional regulator
MRLTRVPRKQHSWFMGRLNMKPRSDAAEHLKLVAQKLFAERGVDGVTVREIAEAAGQKNHAAVGYYFGSKENLVRELIIDGAAVIDERRNRMLDDMEAVGGPASVADVVEALIRPSVDLGDVAREGSYTRFIVMLAMTHRMLFMDALQNRWNSGYQRCLEHLRRLMPDLPDEVKNQRFVFLGSYLGGVLSMREAALTDGGREHPTWSSPRMLEHFAATVTGLLTAPYPPNPAGSAKASKEAAT